MKAREDFSQLFAKIQRKSEIREFFYAFFGHTCQKVPKIARKKHLSQTTSAFCYIIFRSLLQQMQVN
ncbi:MAG: hypothetical protein EGR93_09810 [Prevotella sp.]|nr:hypothetical protein [Prevotella sp.]